MLMRLPLILTLVFASVHVQSKIQDQPINRGFVELYKNELTQASMCATPSKQLMQICSPVLRNDKTGPYILSHQSSTQHVIVLFHGLSDSPFYFRSIAKALFEQGNNVVVALLPGHGLKEAELDMKDSDLAKRWQDHVARVIALSQTLGDNLILGGFSTGAALALNHHLNHPESNVKAMLMFSGAFALNERVEKMARIPGIKWVTKWLDGEYEVDNSNPYKYPNVSKHAATMLMDIIFENRDLLKTTELSLPIFFAHSQADVTTPLKGVEGIIQVNQNDSELFLISENFQVCHGNLVLNQKQVNDIGINESPQPDEKACGVPVANPRHKEMLRSAIAFLKNLSRA